MLRPIAFTARGKLEGEKVSISWREGKIDGDELAVERLKMHMRIGRGLIFGGSPVDIGEKNFLKNPGTLAAIISDGNAELPPVLENAKLEWEYAEDEDEPVVPSGVVS